LRYETRDFEWTAIRPFLTNSLLNYLACISCSYLHLATRLRVHAPAAQDIALLSLTVEVLFVRYSFRLSITRLFAPDCILLLFQWLQRRKFEMRCLPRAELFDY
jgi:hypothetical protein